MGQFKDKNGKSRIGLFLQNVAPSLLSVASGLTGVAAFDKISEAVSGSGTLTPDDKSYALELIRLDIENEKEVTKRHDSDMTSDSWLSKNVRPMVLIYMIFFFSILVVVDSSLKSFTVSNEYIILIKSLMVSVFLFFFGGREIQKAILNRKK